MNDRMSDEDVEAVFNSLDMVTQGLFESGQLRIAKDEIKRAREAENRMECGNEELRLEIRQHKIHWEDLQKENAELKDRIKDFYTTLGWERMNVDDHA